MSHLSKLKVTAACRWPRHNSVIENVSLVLQENGPNNSGSSKL